MKNGTIPSKKCKTYNSIMLKEKTNRRIGFFNVNRINYTGGAEQYIKYLAHEMKTVGCKTIYIGTYKAALIVGIIGSFFLGSISLNQLFIDIKKLQQDLYDNSNSELLSFSENIKIRTIDILMSMFGNSTLKDKEKLDFILVKNEVIDMIVFLLMPIKFKKSYCIIFTSIHYSGGKTFRSIIHNMVYESYFYRKMLGKYDKIIVSNMDDMSLLIKKHYINPKKINLIPYAISDSFLKFNTSTTNSSPAKETKILFVARLEEQKGVEDLVEIIKYFDEKNMAVKFTIIGNGPLRDLVVNLTNEYNNIQYFGEIDNNHMPSYYLSTDLVIVLSKWETFCYVALEAQILGVPVLSYDISGPNEIILNTISGELADNLDHMKKLITDFCIENKYYVDREYFVTKYSKRELMSNYMSIMGI